MNTLPDNLSAALLAYDDPVAVLTWTGEGDDRDADLVVKVAAADIKGFRGAAVRYQWELGLFSSGPVLCLDLDILDNPRNPYSLETFLDVAKTDDLALARRLANQGHLTLHFYDMSLGYRFSKRIAHREVQRVELAVLIGQALDHLATVERPDWYQARLQFMREAAR